jgi:hypothetical protein
MLDSLRQPSFTKHDDLSLLIAMFDSASPTHLTYDVYYCQGVYRGVDYLSNLYCGDGMEGLLV